MIDITHKHSTLRQAIAAAKVVVGKQATIDAILNKTVPKGDVFSSSKTVGLLGVKKTAELLPDCHPMPIEFTDVRFSIDGLEINIEVEVKTIYKTGVEVEAMHGASLVALNIYDMLKPIDKNIMISDIRLLSKKGGKSDFNEGSSSLTAAVVVCSDSVSAGKKEDKAGKVICQKLEQHGVKISAYEIIPDEKTTIANRAIELVDEGNNMVFFTGGTGLSKRDVTPEALLPLIEREIPGMAEYIRNYGQERTPYSMLSRSVTGLIKDTLIVALPGSTNGAKESMDALLPHIFHIFKVINGGQH